MPVNIRTIALHVYDVVISLLPGSKSNPDSFESRARRTVTHFTNEVDRATAIAQARINAAIAATTKIEAKIESQAREALASAEALAAATQLRVQRLKQLLDGE